MAATILAWSAPARTSYNEECGLEDYCVRTGDHDYTDEEQEPPWVTWENYLIQMEDDVRENAAKVCAAVADLSRTSTNGAVGSRPDGARVMASSSNVTSTERKFGGILVGETADCGGKSAVAASRVANKPRIIVPTMPTVQHHPRHRPKLHTRIPIPALVARPVSKRERARVPAAQAAMDKEWDRLRAVRTWDEYVVREWRDVAREAKQRGEEVLCRVQSYGQ